MTPTAGCYWWGCSLVVWCHSSDEREATEEIRGRVCTWWSACRSSASWRLELASAPPSLCERRATVHRHACLPICLLACLLPCLVALLVRRERRMCLRRNQKFGLCQFHILSTRPTRLMPPMHDLYLPLSTIYCDFSEFFSHRIRMDKCYIGANWKYHFVAKKLMKLSCNHRVSSRELSITFAFSRETREATFHH